MVFRVCYNTSKRDRSWPAFIEPCPNENRIFYTAVSLEPEVSAYLDDLTRRMGMNRSWAGVRESDERLRHLREHLGHHPIPLATRRGMYKPIRNSSSQYCCHHPTPYFQTQRSDPSRASNRTGKRCPTGSQKVGPHRIRRRVGCLPIRTRRRRTDCAPSRPALLFDAVVTYFDRIEWEFVVW